VPLDIGFERGYSLDNPGVYRTILPVVFGSPKCQRATELEYYLSHMQAALRSRKRTSPPLQRFWAIPYIPLVQKRNSTVNVQ
jgi:hypothetical protein